MDMMREIKVKLKDEGGETRGWFKVKWGMRTVEMQLEEQREQTQVDVKGRRVEK